MLDDLPNRIIENVIRETMPRTLQIKVTGLNSTAKPPGKAAHQSLFWRRRISRRTTVSDTLMKKRAYLTSPCLIRVPTVMGNELLILDFHPTTRRGSRSR